MEKRNKYLEGKRRLRNKPFITARSIILVTMLSALAYVAFWFYVPGQSSNTTILAVIRDQILGAVLVILIIISVALVCGSLIGFIRKSLSPSTSFDDLISAIDKNKTQERDQIPGRKKEAEESREEEKSR